MISLKENLKSTKWCKVLLGYFSVLPGKWDLMISVLHYLQGIFNFLCRSKPLCLFQKSEDMNLQYYTTLLVLPSPIPFWIRSSILCTFILILFPQHLAFSSSIYFSFFWSLSHATTPSFNFHSSSSTPKYFLSLNLRKTSLLLFVHKPS